MNIIMNERIYAEDAIAAHDLGRRPSVTLSCVAKYYMAQKYKKSEVARLLEDFLLKCDPSINILKWSDLIQSVIRFASSSPMVEIDGVPVTKKELDYCDSLASRQEGRLLFTLICMAKFSDQARNNKTGWVNYPDKDIFSIANITKPIRIQSLMLNSLRDSGKIRFSNKIDNIHINVTCLDYDDEAELYITDFRNLGYQYMSRFGGSYVCCNECGKMVRRNSNNQKYCKECATAVNQRKSEARRITKQAG